MAFTGTDQQTSSSDFDEGLLPMKPIHPLDPVCMSPEARLSEVAAILALGILRLRTPPGLHEEREPQKDLGFCPPQRVHSTPDTQVRSAVRTALLAKMKGV